LTKPVFNPPADTPPQEFTCFSAWSYYHSVVLGHTLHSVKNEQQVNVEWHDVVTGDVWYLTPETTYNETLLC
jgi:hypothetical protein